MKKLLSMFRRKPAVDLPTMEEIHVGRTVISRAFLTGKISREAYAKGCLYLDRSENLLKEANKIALQRSIECVRTNARPINPEKVVRKFLSANAYF